MYEFDSRVRYSEVDHHGTMTVPALINYFQDCSTFQSEDLGIGTTVLKEEKRAWLLSYWQVILNRKPELGEKITIGTFATEFKGLFGNRNFYMKDADGKYLACANSVWAFIDTETGRPTRPQPKDVQLYGVEEPLDIPYEGRKIRLPEETDDLEVFIPAVIEYAEEVLNKTPEMLPVLKEAGVVDSGGQGLLEVIKGGYDAFLGKEIDYSSIKPSTSVTVNKVNAEDTADIKFGYCTEFIILTEKEFTEEDEHEFKKFLSSIGDSIVCVADDDVVKIHVHTNDPGLAIQKALTYGQLSKMKIDNMREEHQEKLIRDAEKLAEEQAKEEAAYEEKKTAEPRKAMGFITVSIGAGMNEIFKELGADYIIEGGQTMNPSTEDMLNAIDQVNADTVFILPNNKNIILAANQAKSLVEDKEIIVIPTKTVPQGITAIINFMPDADAKTNEEAMLEEIKNVKTGQMTYAVRDTHIDDKEIHEGDIMGIGDSGILAVGKDLEETTKELIANLVDEDSELISIYYGEEVSEEEAEKFAGEIEELYPDVDVDIQFGGQPIYYYVLAVE